MCVHVQALYESYCQLSLSLSVLVQVMVGQVSVKHCCMSDSGGNLWKCVAHYVRVHVHVVHTTTLLGQHSIESMFTLSVWASGVGIHRKLHPLFD